MANNPGSFNAVAGHPATVSALARAHPQLRDLGEPALRLIASHPAPAGDLVRLHEEVTAALAPDWFDSADLLKAAASNVTAIEGPVVLYLPGRIDNGQKRLLAAIPDLVDVRSGHATNIATRVLHASDSDDEVRCVVRDVVARLQENERVAVLYSDRTPYARLLAEQFHDARITINGPGSRPVSERSTARTFLDLLALAENDVPRADRRFLGVVATPAGLVD